MAKKSRRAKKRTKRRRSIPASVRKQPVAGPSPTVAKEKEIEAQAQEKATELTEEYRYVYSDLKRIAILAGIMLTALIVLSLVIG